MNNNTIQLLNCSNEWRSILGSQLLDIKPIKKHTKLPESLYDSVCTVPVWCLASISLYPGIVHPVCASQIPSKTTSFEYVRKHLFWVQHQEEVIVASAISGILQGMKIQSLKWQGKCHSTNCLHGKTTCCFSLEAILRFMKLPKILAIRCNRHIT